MSRTDKTDPDWVQMRHPQFPYKIVEHHYHHVSWWDGQCKLDYPVPVTRRPGWAQRLADGDVRCEYWVRYGDTEKIEGRSRWRRSFGSFQDHRARADLRRLRAKWCREPVREDIDSTENLPSARWRWRMWYWD